MKYIHIYIHIPYIIYYIHKPSLAIPSFPIHFAASLCLFLTRGSSITVLHFIYAFAALQLPPAASSGSAYNSIACLTIRSPA